MQLLVMAKQPVAGSVKTRLCPPCTAAEAAELAEAALVDTLDAASASGADRVVLALAGRPGPWLPEGIEVIQQQGVGFAQRLAAAWDRIGGPAVQLGMDTPQIDAGLLDQAMTTLDEPGCDAVLGPAVDGGWWAIGLRAADARVFERVPMSRSDTGHHQLARLAELELRTTMLPPLIDVDTIDDARAVAAQAPSTRFSRRLAAIASAFETTGAGTWSSP